MSEPKRLHLTEHTVLTIDPGVVVWLGEWKDDMRHYMCSDGRWYVYVCPAGDVAKRWRAGHEHFNYDLTAPFHPTAEEAQQSAERWVEDRAKEGRG